MFYDKDGRPDANGSYQLINGKLCLREGCYAAFDVLLMDSRPFAATLSDSEAYEHIRARAKHDLRYGYLPADQRPRFQLDAISVGAPARNSAPVVYSAEIASLRPKAKAAAITRKYLVSNAWRS